MQTKDRMCFSNFDLSSFEEDYTLLNTSSLQGKIEKNDTKILLMKLSGVFSDFYDLTLAEQF